MEINGLGHVDSAHAIRPSQRTESVESTRQTESVVRADEVDISPEAEMLGQVDQIPDIRTERVEEIRLQIAEGTYETDAKMDIAVGRLLDEIG